MSNDKFQAKIRTADEIAHLDLCYRIAKEIASTMTDADRIATAMKYEAIDTDTARAMANGYRDSVVNQFDAIRDDEGMTMAPVDTSADTSAEAWEAEQVAPLHLVRTMLDGATGWAIQWYQGNARYEARVWWVRQNQSSTTYAASYTDKLTTYTTWGSLDQCAEWLSRLSGRTVICK